MSQKHQHSHVEDLRVMAGHCSSPACSSLYHASSSSLIPPDTPPPPTPNLSPLFRLPTGFPSSMLPCCPGSTSINKAEGTECFWMGGSCWQDLSRLFMEGLVSCYHWDVAACGNSGENRPLMPPPLGAPTPFLCSPFDGSSVKYSSATGGPTYWHQRRRRRSRRCRGRRTHTAQQLFCTFHCTFIQCDRFVSYFS